MSGVQQPGANPFDAADLARIKANNGGKINSVQAVRQIEAEIRSDGRIDAAELALLDKVVSGMASSAKAGFEVEAVGFAFDRLLALRPQQTIPGSAVTGSPPRFANPLQMANDVGQLDDLDSTTFDESRCAATSLAYELCFQGPEAMQAIINGIRNDPNTPAEVKAGLQGVDVRSGNVSRQTFHLMVEGLHAILSAVDPASSGAGVSGFAVAGLLRAAGLSDGTPSSSPPSGLAVGQRALVMGAFQPGSSARHWVVIGRDATGYYRIDPYARNNSGSQSTGNTVHRFPDEAAMQAYVRSRSFDFGADRAPGGPARGVVTLTLHAPTR